VRKSYSKHNVRKQPKLKPKRKVIVVKKDGAVHVITLKPIREMRGFVKGMDTSQIRDEQDRL